MRLVAHLFRVMLALLCSFLFLEVWLQTAEIQNPLETYVHSEFGPLYTPNLDIARYNEGFFLGSTNAWGTLGEGRPMENQSSEYRVMLVGDSFVLGHTVFERHHFKNKLEETLAILLGRDVCVLNFGRPDMNLWNMHRFYQDFVCRWDHDLALLFFSEYDAVPRGQVGRSLYPVTKLTDDGIVADYSFRQSFLYRFSQAVNPLLSRSSLLRMAFNAYKTYRRGELPRIFLGKFAPGKNAPSKSSTSNPPKRKSTPTMPDLSRAILQDFSRDRRVVCVLTGNTSPKLMSQIRESTQAVLELEPLFDRMRTEGIDPYFWSATGMKGHWNHDTHERLGPWLAQELSFQGFLEAASEP